MPSFVLTLFTSFGLALCTGAVTAHRDNGAVCPDDRPASPYVAYQDVYRGMPFQPGERASYTVDYLGVRAGHGVLEVH
ncbi:MAG: hypothetical protein ACE5LB_10240, partial [Acidiferrobacterales bacterium]